MSNLAIKEDRESIRLRVEKITEEIASLEAQVLQLEQQSSRTPALFRILRKWFSFGDEKNIEWLRFKLKLKQQELDYSKAQYEKLTGTVLRFGSALRQAIYSCQGEETARKKMGRMIKENPGALAPHIRRIYEPLIEAEESVEK